MAWNLESPLRHLHVHFKTIILVPKSKNLVYSSSKNEIEVFGPPCGGGPALVALHNFPFFVCFIFTEKMVLKLSKENLRKCGL